MSRVEFTLETSQDIGLVMVPVIDGVRLPDFLKPIETPFAQKEGHVEMAGSYDGVPIDQLGSPDQYLMGQIKAPKSESKISLLECGCGCEGCWPFVVKVTVSDDIVIWSDFEQPHRSKTSVAGFWDYSQIPPFKFERRQYEQAIASFKCSIQTSR